MRSTQTQQHSLLAMYALKDGDVLYIGIIINGGRTTMQSNCRLGVRHHKSLTRRMHKRVACCVPTLNMLLWTPN